MYTVLLQTGYIFVFDKQDLFLKNLKNSVGKVIFPC